MKTVLLIRQEEQAGKQTLGQLTIFDGIEEVFSCKTLEPVWKWNQPFESCIPQGTYNLSVRESSTHNYHLRLTTVEGGEIPGREFILIHSGNFKSNTAGCILPGEKFVDIDSDGFLDVTSSRNTLNKILDHLQLGAQIKIIALPTLKYF
jgi:hypothetical protein